MNHQFLESCYVFEELGGPKGKDGTYNPEEVEEYRQRLNALDEDAAARYEQWVKAADEMQASHSTRCLPPLSVCLETMVLSARATSVCSVLVLFWFTITAGWVCLTSQLDGSGGSKSDENV